MSKRFRGEPVIVDVDGVLADFTLGYRRLARLWYGLPVWSTREQATWCFSDVTQEQDDAIWGYVNDPAHEFWLTLDSLVSGPTWTRLRDLGRQRPVYYVTARTGSSAKRQTEVWLHRRVGEPCSVVATGQKGLFAKAVEATHAVDDHDGNVADLARCCAAYLMEQPYNAASPWPRRVKTVDEFIDVVLDGR